jgi:hypothetical protein
VAGTGQRRESLFEKISNNLRSDINTWRGGFAVSVEALVCEPKSVDLGGSG